MNDRLTTKIILTANEKTAYYILEGRNREWTRISANKNDGASHPPRVFLLQMNAERHGLF